MNQPEQIPGLYQDVEVYDVLHAPGTASEVLGLRRMARRFVGAGAQQGVWLEPACGTGRYLCAAAARGTRCYGFDSSETMVSYASERLAAAALARPEAAQARVFQANMTDFLTGLGRAGVRRAGVDFAFNPINTIRHLESDDAMIAHMREMAAALQPRGVYAVGLSTTIYGAEMPDEDVWEGRRRGVRVKQIVQYEPPARGRFEKVYSHLVVRRAGMEEHRDSAYRLRCYSREQWLRLIGRCGMDLLDTVDEDGESIAAPELGYALWILRARG